MREIVCAIEHQYYSVASISNDYNIELIVEHLNS